MNVPQIAANTTLDRERQSVLRFYVVASDMPQGGAEQRSSRVLVTVDVIDVNDNEPSFAQESYTAVIPENAPVGISVVNITATDPDEGEGGTIHYEIVDEGEANGTSRIDEEQTGHFIFLMCKQTKLFIYFAKDFSIYSSRDCYRFQGCSK